MKNLIPYLLLLGLFALACTPKTTDRTTDKNDNTTTEKPVAKNENCRTFDDTPWRDDALDNYIIYGDRIDQERYEEALELWKFVYDKAPDADGKRNVIYTDGVKIYSHFYKQTQNEQEKTAYFDTINMLYEQSLRCYNEPEDKALIAGSKAFDAYYNFPDRISQEENYNMFLTAFDGYEQDDTPAFLINPFTALMVDRYLQEEIPTEEAKKWATYITATIDRKKEILSPEMWKREGWNIVAGYAPTRLEALEGVEGFYDCEYYRGKYLEQFSKNPKDCETLSTVYSRLRWGGCPKEDTDVVAVWNALNANNCINEPEPKETVAGQAYRCLREGDYNCAIKNFEKAATETTDNAKKSRYYFLIAKIYYAHLKRYSQSRSYALKAAQYRGGWGEPYILIGKLYASSGPLCGSGRGWNSQVVTWPAIDKWSYAKSIDSGVAAEANRLIGQYSKYMPSRGDIFQRNLQEGSNYTVGCWINETTKIRAAK